MQKSVDERVVITSTQSFEELTKPENGKNFHLTCDKNVELPVKIRPSGFGAETPETLCDLFYKTSQQYKARNAIFVQRGGKVLSWTWA